MTLFTMFTVVMFTNYKISTSYKIFMFTNDKISTCKLVYKTIYRSDENQNVRGVG